jgi:hypothetical protein
VRFTKNGETATGLSLNGSPASIIYDSVNDKYIIGTSSPAYQITLTRTYNKATEFCLPIIDNTFIKVQ